jgi:tRNA U38,U39,U40 pseudouridine synthase TruA
MVGTLLNVGRGHWEPRRIAEILAAGDRGGAGPTAPALGLCLRWVRYPPRLLSPQPGLEMVHAQSGVGDDAGDSACQ